MKKIIYFLLPLQIIVLLLSPRFGWNINMHKSDGLFLSYKGTSYEDGAFHCLYQNQYDTIDISYSNPFSKKFTILVNDTETYSMQVTIDGASVGGEENILLGISAGIVCKDTYGILFWRCIMTIAMSLISMKVFSRATASKGGERKLLFTGASIIYIVAILISLRIIY